MNNSVLKIVGNPCISFDGSGNELSHVYSPVWDFHALKQNTRKVVFENVQSEHRANIQSYIYEIMTYQKDTSPSNFHASVRTIEKYKTHLSAMAARWGRSDFESLSNEREWKRFSASMEGYGSMGTIKGLASTINVLNQCGLVNRYVTLEEYAKWKRDGSNGVGQAMALPEAIHANLLINSNDFLEKYYPYRHKISEVMEQGYKLHDKLISEELSIHMVEHASDLDKKVRCRITARVTKEINKLADAHGIPDFKMNRQGHWLSALLNKCYLTVLLFSAARQNETLSMSKKSYNFDKIKGVATVKGYTTKGNNGKKRYTTWVTAPIAGMALELAYDATNSARQYQLEHLGLAFKNEAISIDQYEYHKESLEGAFIATSIPTMAADITNKESFKLNVGVKSTLNTKDLDIVATQTDVDEFNLLNPDRDGDLKVGGGLPKLSSHDIRRSFVVFMVRNRLGNELTIKYQLKHRNLNMSNWYAKFSELARTSDMLMDTSLKEEMDNAINDAVIDAMDDIYNVTKVLSGKAGEKLAAKKKQEKRDKLKDGEAIYMTRDQISDLVKSGDISIVILPTGGYCTNRDCERLCSLMDVTEAPCSHKIITDKSALKLSKERDRLIESFRNINNMEDIAYSLILEARYKKVKSIEPTLDKHNINYEPFSDSIKAG